MIFDYSKLNIIIYFLTGIISSLVLKQYIFGGLIMFLSACILIQYSIINSGEPTLYKYKNITAGLPYLGLILVLGASFYVLNESNQDSNKKLYTLAIFMMSIVFYIIKEAKKNDYEILQRYMVQQIPSILLMVYLLLISVIPENENSLINKISEFRYKTEIKNL